MKFPALLLVLVLCAPAFAEPGPLKVRVKGWFAVRDGFGKAYRVNVQMPDPYTDNSGHWSLTCEHGISPGMYDGTYDHGKNDLRIVGADMKGRASVDKCHVFSHDWRAAR